MTFRSALALLSFAVFPAVTTAVLLPGGPVWAQRGASIPARPAPPPPIPQDETRALQFPLRYPPGHVRYPLLAEGYARSSDGRYSAASIVNRFRMKVPPADGPLLLTCDVEAGPFDTLGEFYWGFDDDRNFAGGGASVEFPRPRGLIRRTIPPLENGMRRIDSVWFVAPRGTRFAWCTIEPVDSAAGRTTP